MTNYDTLPAGREMDALVAEALGFTVVHREWPCGHDPECGHYGAAAFVNSDYEPWCPWYDERGPVIAAESGIWPPKEDDDPVGIGGEFDLYAYVEPVPFYSTDIKAAWQIIEHLVNSGYCPALIYDDNGHWALVTDGMQNVLLDDKPGDVATMFFIEAKDWFDTAPLAICRAALKAVSE